MTTPETVHAEATIVACDGGGGALGHPLVYLVPRESDGAKCPYCSRTYVLQRNHERKGESEAEL